jgi:transposase
MPHLDGICFEVFLEQLRAAYPGDRLVVVMDQAGAHVSGSVEWPEEVEPLFLPPRSPELDPAERWFRELRGSTSNEAYATLADLEEAVTMGLAPYWEDELLLARLTGYSWWIAATGSILTSPK